MCAFATAPEPGHTPTQLLSTMSASPADHLPYAEIRMQVSAGRTTAMGTGYYESFQPPSIAAA